MREVGLDFSLGNNYRKILMGRMEWLDLNVKRISHLEPGVGVGRKVD